MEKKLKLPIGIQSFEKLREKKCVYVDKTKYLVDIIDNEDICFLARPRRFGKSLTVSTFKALFSGKKELFKGLYAEEFVNSLNYETSPVIHLDMSQITNNCGIEIFKDSLKQKTLRIASELEVKIKNSISVCDILDELIINTAKKYNQKVVILLDEYDKPYTDFINDIEMSDKIRESLRNFYVHIKANDEYIRFTFITGISKFAKFGVFSTLNSPLDISMMQEYAEICGLTEEEIIRYFPDYIEDIANYKNISTEELIKKLRNYYNGFSFDSRAAARLYNPYSTLTFFKKKEFLNYWVDTGRSKMIAEYMKNRSLTVEQFRNIPISKDFAQNPGDMDTTSPEGFLNQAGYLTLRPGITDELSLDYPNTEVLNSMSALVAQNILQEKNDDFIYCRRDLIDGLSYQDYEKVKDTLNRLLASIPYDDFAQAAKDSISRNKYYFTVNEWHYRSMILAFLRGCGVVVFAEMHTNLGRSDLVITHKGKIWIVEIKIAYKEENPQKKMEEAIQQIKDKNYAKPYPNAICFALVIEDEKRQITKWRIEK